MTDLFFFYSATTACGFSVGGHDFGGQSSVLIIYSSESSKFHDRTLPINLDRPIVTAVGKKTLSHKSLFVANVPGIFRRLTDLVQVLAVLNYAAVGLLDVRVSCDRPNLLLESIIRHPTKCYVNSRSRRNAS